METIKESSTDFLSLPEIKALKSYPFLQRINKLLLEEGTMLRPKVNFYNFELTNQDATDIQHKDYSRKFFKTHLSIP